MTLYASYHWDLPSEDHPGVPIVRAALRERGWEEVFKGRAGTTTALWTRTYQEGETTNEEISQALHELLLDNGIEESHVAFLTPHKPIMIGGGS